MSARVFNPVVLSEMRRMLKGDSQTSSSGYHNETSGSPSDDHLARVRRELFGPVDHEEARRFVERELKDQNRRDGERWGFDFEREVPHKSGPGASRYAWQAVTPSESIPGPYALRRLSYLKRHTDTTTTVKSVANEQSESATTTITTTRATVPKQSTSSEISSTTTSANTTPRNNNSTKKQPLITDFMKNRKRACGSGESKMAAVSEPTSKRLRSSTETSR